MRTRLLKPADAPEIYDIFMSAQVDRKTAHKNRSGFYEYPLKEKDIRDRLIAGQGLSIALTEGRKVSSPGKDRGR